MSFGRPGGSSGGLSINTGAANSVFGQSNQSTGSGFGTTSQPQQSGGLFGSQQQSSSGLFGSQPTQQQGGGLFGSQPQGQPQGAGLFGSSQLQPQQTGGGFGSFNQPSQSQPQQTGGVFGSFNQQSQSQPQQTGGSFGSGNQAFQSHPQQAGGLFGQINTQQQGGSLFGGNLQQPQQQQQPGNLFGGNIQQPQQQQHASGLFGSTNVQNQPQQGGSLFESSVTQNQTGGIFGNQNQNQDQQQQSGLFGSVNNDNTPNMFGRFGQQNQQNQQAQQPGPNLLGNQPPNLQAAPMIPGVRIDVSNIRSTTRFTDLHEDLQRQLQLIESLVIHQISCHNQCKAMMPKHAEGLAYLPNDVEHVARRERTLTETLMNDVQAIAHVRDTINADADDAKLSFTAIDNLRLLPQYHHVGNWKLGASSLGISTIDGEEPARDLVAYFSQRADNMSLTLQQYMRNLAQVESHLRGVEARTGQQIQQLAFSRGRDGESRTADDQIRELAAVLRDFEGGILGVAGRVGAAREGVQQLTLGTAGAGMGLDAGLGGQLLNGNSGRRW
ncbi:MAG: hypothetical protein M1816_005500 [Peltula sp. TS41687]|nr:MAG: hypothetical protein M1816_005500 [Peltula sp. TS41687]